MQMAGGVLALISALLRAAAGWYGGIIFTTNKCRGAKGGRLVACGCGGGGDWCGVVW